MFRDLEARVVGLIRPAAPAPQEPPKAGESPDESALVSAFLGRVTVEPIRTSRLVDVTFVSSDPKFASLAVNTLIDEYVEQNLAIKLESSQNSSKWLARSSTSSSRKCRKASRRWRPIATSRTRCRSTKNRTSSRSG